MSKVTLESVAAEFRSGNSVPVERATLTRECMQEALEAYAAAKVREALEKAARMAEEQSDADRKSYEKTKHPYHEGAADAAGIIEEYIRGLIPTDSRPGHP